MQQQHCASEMAALLMLPALPFFPLFVPNALCWLYDMMCAAPSTGSQLALHIGETTLQMPCTPAQAQKLDAALAKLLQTFSDKQAAKRPKR